MKLVVQIQAASRCMHLAAQAAFNTLQLKVLLPGLAGGGNQRAGPVRAGGRVCGSGSHSGSRGRTTV